MNLRRFVLPFALAGAVACAVRASSLSGTELADLPGDAKLFTADQVAALFDALDSTNALAALQAILSTNAVLREELMAMHERDCIRVTNDFNNILVIDPYGEQGAFVHNTESDNLIVTPGLLNDATHGDCGYENDYDWPRALYIANELLEALSERHFEDMDGFVGAVNDLRARIYSFESDGGSFDDLLSLSTSAESILAVATNPPAGCQCGDVVSDLAALTARVNQITPCGCDLAGFVSTLQGVVSDLSSAVSGLNADYQSLESRISALETAIGNLSPAAVAERTGQSVQTVTTIINGARQEAAAAAVACADVQDAVEEVVAVAEAAEDLVEGVIEHIGEI